MFGLIGRNISRMHDGANADDVSTGACEVTSSRADQLGLELSLAPHKQLLHFLGRLVFVVLAQVPVTARYRNLLGVGRDLLFNQFVILILAALEALPGNNEVRFPLRLVAGDQRLNSRIAFDDSSQQRALVHVIERGGQLQSASKVLDYFKIRGANEFNEQFLIIEDIISEAI